MNWGGVLFVRKTGKCGGVFCKKSGPFLNAGCIMYSISFFNFTFYLFGGRGCVRTQRTHLLPTGLSCLADRTVTLTDGRESVHGTRTENSWGSIYDIQCSLIS